MNRKKVKVLVGLAIYLCIQIPVAILGMRGIYLQDILESRKEVVPLDIQLDLGKKQIHDYTTGRTFGEITILENGEDFMIVDIESDEIEGRDDVFNKAYRFPDIKVKGGVFSKSHHNNQYYWVNEQEDSFILIFRVERDRYFNVPDSIKKDEGIVFYITRISKHMYNYYIGKKTGVSMSIALQNSMYRNTFSAYFKN